MLGSDLAADLTSAGLLVDLGHSFEHLVVSVPTTGISPAVGKLMRANDSPPLSARFSPEDVVI